MAAYGGRSASAAPSGDNSWVWILAIGALVYFLSQSNAASAANAGQVGIPAGSKVVGSNVINSTGQVIGSVTTGGYFISNAQPTANPLTGVAVNAATQNPIMTPPPGTTPLSGCQYNSAGQLLYCA